MKVLFKQASCPKTNVMRVAARKKYCLKTNSTLHVYIQTSIGPMYEIEYCITENHPEPVSWLYILNKIKLLVTILGCFEDRVEDFTQQISADFLQLNQKKVGCLNAGMLLAAVQTGCFHCERSLGCFWLHISVKGTLQTSAIRQTVYSAESLQMGSITRRHPGWFCLV